MEKIFDGIYKKENKIYTINLNPGKKVYGERLILDNHIEYREWNPFKSKYCAGIVKGIKKSIFTKGETVLYLGSAEGTTVSHVSDIIGCQGDIFCVDLSEIAMGKLTKLAESRENILPILSDANKTSEYEEFIEDSVDALFADVSQRNQTEIFIKNSKFLKKGGLGALSLKTKSISQTKKVSDILEEEKKKLENVFNILEVINIEPYEKSHYLIMVEKI
jgi:fibrillarin-like pre-rRNA processing protein